MGHDQHTQILHVRFSPGVMLLLNSRIQSEYAGENCYATDPGAGGTNRLFNHQAVRVARLPGVNDL